MARHLWRWFLDLGRTRGKHTIVVAGLAGSQVISEPAPITWQEISSWERVTGRKLGCWEAEQIAMMDTVWLAASQGQGQQRDGQGLGEYCGGKFIEKCRQMFGNEDVLKQACSTCPN